MRAANAIGDDKLMQQAGRAPVESMFTHGTSEQRMEALKRGIQSKSPEFVQLSARHFLATQRHCVASTAKAGAYHVCHSNGAAGFD